MRVTIGYDPGLEACTVRSESAFLKNEGDVATWGRTVEAELAAAGRGRSYLMIDLDGIEVDMAAREAFGSLVRQQLLRHAAAVRFFGKGAGFTTTVLLLESVRGPSTLRPLADEAAAREELARVRRRRLTTRRHVTLGAAKV